MGLRATAPGMVVAAREPLAEIIPASPRLVIEARIRPEDVAQVAMGAGADVRLTAFNPRTTPLVEGRVTYVAGDRAVDRANELPYYAVHIEARRESLAALEGVALQAGMPAEVFVRGRTRTALQYLVEPVSDVLRRGVRER
jgi:membrane fusion protein, epimerase transport system